MKSVMTANIIIQSVYAICVTVAACYTDRPLLTITTKQKRGGADGESDI